MNSHDGRKLVHRLLLDRALRTKAQHPANSADAKLGASLGHTPASSELPTAERVHVTLATPTIREVDSSEGRLIASWYDARREHGLIEPLRGSDPVDAMYRIRIDSRYGFVPRGWKREYFGDEAWRRLATWFEVDEQPESRRGAGAVGSLELERVAFASNPNTSAPDDKGRLRLNS